MTVHLYDHKLTYVGVPKCACSTAKLFLHRIKTGKPFKREENGPRIHQLYPTVAFEDLPHDQIADHLKIAVVRGPVSRILSAYQSKVVNSKCLHRPAPSLKCRAKGLSLDPSFEVFWERFDDYREACRELETHTRPLRFYLGDDPDWFDHIINIKNFEKFRDVVGERTGKRYDPGRRNKTENPIKMRDVDPALRQSIRERFQSDLDIFGAHIAGKAT